MKYMYKAFVRWIEQDIQHFILISFVWIFSESNPFKFKQRR